MGSLIGLILVPLIVGGAMFYFFKSTITWKEYLLMEGAAILIAVLGFFIARWGSAQDTEYWNGRITNKDRSHMSCCHCSQVCTGHDSNGNCNSWTEVCSHSYDLMWSLDVSTGDSITVDSCEPP